MVAVGDRIHSQDLIGRRGTPQSNRECRLRIGRRWRLLLQLNSAGETEAGRHHSHQLGRAQARATVDEMLWGLTLRDLEDKGNPFCKLTVKETVEGEQATAAWFGRRLAMVRVASGGAAALRSSSTTSPCFPQSPPSINCFWHWWFELERQLSPCAKVWGLRTEIRRVWAGIYRASWSYS
jgi:hypothetical protein